jgi:hypothetical protein
MSRSSLAELSSEIQSGSRDIAEIQTLVKDVKIVSIIQFVIFV